MKTATQAVQTGELASTAQPAERTPACSLAACSVSKANTAAWAQRTLQERLTILRRARRSMATQAHEFAAAIAPDLARTKADTLVTELLPLLDAMRYLERNARRLLMPRKLGRSGRPWWLAGVAAEIYREPLGRVLIIGPSNFPLFLPGVQTMQALAAGNIVTWKPGAGGGAVAALVGGALAAAGLPDGVLQITQESVETAQAALAARPDKVIFTGSESAGHHVLAKLAETATPAVVELSGADAILVMPSANLTRVARAVAFGLRLNGAAVCMSPRRVFASQRSMAALLPLLVAEIAAVPAVTLNAQTAERLQTMLFEAMTAGATLHGEFNPVAQRPLMLSNVTPQMAIARSDIFAPVVSLLAVQSEMHALEQYAECPYALTAALFCSRQDEPRARAIARMLKAGTVLINDIIAPTADPRVPFGGRGASGYGVTRGAEGLLEMTCVKTVLVRRGNSTRHMEPTREQDAAIFAEWIAVTHGSGLGPRWAALKRLVQSVRR